MKNHKIFLTALGLLLFLGYGAFAQQSPGQKNNYVVLTTKIDQLRPIAMSSAALAEEDGIHFGEFKVVLYGAEVTQLTDQKVMEPLIRLARQSKMKLAVCEMALQKMKVDPRDIPEAFEVVDNAFLHAVQLQKKGYYSLSL